MYTDTLFNFTQMIQNKTAEEGADILTSMAASRPFFALDTGVTSDDIYDRCDRIHKCMDLMDNDEDKKCIQRIMYFSAGVMGDSDSVENRFDYVEDLEKTILAFKSSSDPFASHLVAIGPCGIDHDWDSVEYEGRDHDYFDNSTIDDERNLFALQLTLGKKLDMPVIVHSRRGFKDTSDVLKAVKWNKGVIHGYSYSRSELEFFLDLGWYIGFNGEVTYSGKKMFSDMEEIVTYVPKDRILIESDSPYYAPVPLKNTENTPSNISYTYEYIASKRNISTAKLNDYVDKNCQRLFKL